MKKTNVVVQQDYGTDCKNCERYQKLGDICVLEHGKKFLWEYCRDFVPQVVLPDYKELMRTVRQEQALERKKLREKKERERKKKQKEREERELLRKKERRARKRRLREKAKQKLVSAPKPERQEVTTERGKEKLKQRSLTKPHHKKSGKNEVSISERKEPQPVLSRSQRPKKIKPRKSTRQNLPASLSSGDSAAIDSASTSATLQQP